MNDKSRGDGYRGDKDSGLSLRNLRSCQLAPNGLGASLGQQFITGSVMPMRSARRAISNERRLAQPPRHPKNPLRLKSNFSNPFNLIWVVQSPAQK
jgi:hypothetical protein